MKKEKSRRNKREKKSKRKQKYIPQKALFGNGEDYYIYRMSFVEKLTGGALGFLVGAFVCMTFFRNFLLSGIVGILLILPGIGKYREFLKARRQKALLIQFRDMLESLTASYSTEKIRRELLKMHMETWQIFMEKKQTLCTRLK